jgi:CHAT domain-containing protein
MVELYARLWHRKRPVSALEALRQAQRAMLLEGYERGMVRADKAEKGRVPPAFWAAFVLSGDWR